MPTSQESKTALQQSLALSERLAGELEQVRAAAVELADRYSRAHRRHAPGA